MLKRIERKLALLLSVIMLISMMPANAMAEIYSNTVGFAGQLLEEKGANTNEGTSSTILVNLMENATPFIETMEMMWDSSHQPTIKQTMGSWAKSTAKLDLNNNTGTVTIIPLRFGSAKYVLTYYKSIGGEWIEYTRAYNVLIGKSAQIIEEHETDIDVTLRIWDVWRPDDIYQNTYTCSSIAGFNAQVYCKDFTIVDSSVAYGQNNATVTLKPVKPGKTEADFVYYLLKEVDKTTHENKLIRNVVHFHITVKAVEQITVHVRGVQYEDTYTGKPIDKPIDYIVTSVDYDSAWVSSYGRKDIQFLKENQSFSGINTGTYSAEITESDFVNKNTKYRFVDFVVDSNVKLVINPATIRITPRYKTFVYGTYSDEDLEADVEYSTGVSKVDGFSYKLKREKPEIDDVGYYKVLLDEVKLADNNYIVEFTPNKTICITRAPLNVRAKDVSKTYGDADPSTGVIITDASGNDVTAEILNKGYGQPGGKVQIKRRDTSEDCGTYRIQADGPIDWDNYRITYTNDGKLTINKAQLRVTADNKTKYCHAPDPRLTATATGLKRGDTLESIDLQYELQRAPGEDYGNYPISIKGDKSTKNYNVFYMPGTFTIKNRTVTITPSASSKYWGEKDPTLRGTVSFSSGFTAAEKQEVKEAIQKAVEYKRNGNGQYDDVGKYTISVDIDESIIESYGLTLICNTNTFEIKQYKVYGSIDYKTKKIGEEDPEFTYELTYGPDPQREELIKAEIKDGDIKIVRKDTSEAIGKHVLTAEYKENYKNFYLYFRSNYLEILPEEGLVVFASDYEGEYDGNSVTINAAARVDGGNASDATITYSIGNSGTWSETAPAFTKAGEYTVHVKANLSGYNEASCEYTVKITPKDVQVIPNSCYKTYGDSDPAFTAEVLGAIGADTVEYGFSREDVSESVGERVIKATGTEIQGNYRVTFEEGILYIEPAPLTIKTGSAFKEYDCTPLTYDDVTITGFKNNESAKLHTCASITDVGEVDNALDPDSWDVNGIAEENRADRSNYYFSDIVIGKLRITPATSLHINASGYQGVYDNEEHFGIVTSNLDGTVFKYSTQEDIWTDVPPSIKDVGVKTVVVEGSYPNYGKEQTTYGLVVEPKTIYIHIPSAYKEYGEADPEFENAVILNDDYNELGGINLTVHRTNVDVNNCGIYEDVLDIGKSKEQLEAEYPNYTFVIEKGSFVIDQAMVAINIHDDEKVYGDADPSAYQYELLGLKNNDQPSAISFSIKRKEGENVGEYEIYADMERSRQGNYVVSYVAGTFKIKPAEATIIADAAEKVYGDKDKAFTASVKGMKKGESPALIQYTMSRDAGENVGTYKINAKYEPAQGNYRVKYVSADFTIKRADVVLWANPCERYYGDPDPKLTAYITGLKNNDPASVIDYELFLNPVDAAGEHPIYAFYDEIQGNYRVAEYKDALMTVKKAPLTVTADDKIKVFGSEDPALTATVSGLKNSDTADIVKYELKRDPGENVGDYVIKATGLNDPENYEVAYKNGKFTITTNERLVVLGQDYSGVYDGNVHGAAATVNITAGTTLRYSVDGGKTWTEQYPTIENAGKVSVKVEAVNANYMTAYGSYTLEVKPKEVVITVKNAKKRSGAADPRFKGSVSPALVNKNDLGTIRYVRTNSGVEKPGVYHGVLTATYKSNPNYEVKVVEGDLKITERTYSVTVKYWYDQVGGKKAADTMKRWYASGESYTFTSPEIDGYTPDQERITGKMDDDNLVFDVVYTKNGYTLTIRYLYSDGSIAAPAYATTLAEGEEYSVESPIISGYTADAEIVAGTMNAEDIDVTVIYTADHEPMAFNAVINDGGEYIGFE